MIDAAVLVFHHTGIVSLIRGYYRLHDDGPHMVPELEEKEKKLSSRKTVHGK